MNSILRNDKYREYLVVVLVETISKNQFLDFAIQSLIEFVKNFYFLIQPDYVTALAQHLLPIMKNPKDETVCITCMEFWANFCREEKNIESNPNLMKYVTGPLGEELVQTLLQNLCHIEEVDDDTNGVSEGAAGAL